jgi:hypothetical protein
MSTLSFRAGRSGRTSAQGLAGRSRILAAAEGVKDTEIASRLCLMRATVTKWRNRFAEQGLDGLLDEPWPGRPRTITDEQIEVVIVKTLESGPQDVTHWSTRSMASEVGLTQTRCCGSGRRSGYSRTGRRPGSSLRITSSWTRSATSWAVSQPQSGRCCAGTRKSQIQTLDRTAPPAGAARHARARESRLSHAPDRT